MEYAVSITPRDGYLHVRVHGDNDLDTILRYFDDVLEACAAGGVGHVLVEECLEGSALTLTNIFQIVSAKAEAIRSFLRLIAFVDVHLDRSPVNVKFGETVSEAEAWLSGEIVRRAARPTG